MAVSRLFFFVGKGGVGKTTLSSSFSLMLSKKGLRTLLISTDPAHSLSDILETEIGTRRVEVLPNLYALEIDPYREAHLYLSEVLGRMERLLNPDVFSKVKDMFHLLEDSPGLTETAIIERVSRIVLEESYDALVVDTAPTGHTLQMLRTVSKAGDWIERLIKNREKSESFKRAAGRESRDELVSLMKERRTRLEKFYGKLFSKDTLFVPVLNPEKLPILETMRAVGRLRSMGIDLKYLVVNKVLNVKSEDEFIRKRLAQQEIYMRQIEENFRDLNKIIIPLMERDVKGMEMLGYVSDTLERSWKSS